MKRGIWVRARRLAAKGLLVSLVLETSPGLAESLEIDVALRGEPRGVGPAMAWVEASFAAGVALAERTAEKATARVLEPPPALPVLPAGTGEEVSAKPAGRAGAGPTRLRLPSFPQRLARVPGASGVSRLTRATGVTGATGVVRSSLAAKSAGCQRALKSSPGWTLKSGPPGRRGRGASWDLVTSFR